MHAERLVKIDNLPRSGFHADARKIRMTNSVALQFLASRPGVEIQNLCPLPKREIPVKEAPALTRVYLLAELLEARNGLGLSLVWQKKILKN